MASKDNLSTKSKLQKVALKLFAKNGYDETSTKEICDTANVNSASITYHFGSKEKLLESIIKEQLSSMPVESILEMPKTVEEMRIKLEIFFTIMLEGLYQNTDMYLLMSRDSDINQVIFKAFKNDIIGLHNRMVNFLKSSQDAGFISIDADVSILSHVLMASVMGNTTKMSIPRIFPEIDFNDQEKRKRYVSLALNIFFNGALNRR
jgi:AcrR family transcriptional regulator